MNDKPFSQSNSACAEYDFLIGPYIDDELPDGEAARLEKHLELCQGCKILTLQFQKLDRLAKSTMGLVPPVSAEEWGEVWSTLQGRRAIIYRDGDKRRALFYGDGDKRRALFYGDGDKRRALPWGVPALSFAALVLIGIWLGWSLIQKEPEDQGPPHVQKVEIDPSTPENLRPKIRQGEGDYVIIDFSG
ncbi:MAG: zf-HC2 domain-containing protein [Planctomycetes bacterium]|nr:zf-HC2 domain-containing protein [Planctomycetota bacterium]